MWRKKNMVYKFRLSPKVDNILLHKGIQAKKQGKLKYNNLS